MQNIQNSTSQFYSNNSTHSINGTYALSINLEEILKSTGDPTVSSSCNQPLSQDCGFAVGSYLAYHIPKRTVESLASWSLWTVKQIGKGAEQTVHTALSTTQKLAAYAYSVPSTIEKIDSVAPQINEIFKKHTDSIYQAPTSANTLAELPGDIKNVVIQILPSKEEAADALQKVNEIFLPVSQPVNEKKEFIYEKSERLYESAVNLAETVSSQLTDWFIGKSNDKPGQNQSTDRNSEDNFRAIDLIGATIFLAFCAHQTAKHLNKAYTSTKTLLSNKRISADIYQIKARDQIVVVANTKHHTTPKLAKAALMHTAFAGIAGAAAYCAYNGIYHELEKASGNSAHATQCTLIISLISTLAPNIFVWCKTQVHRKLTSHGSSVNVPKFFYTRPVEIIKNTLVGKYEDTNLGRFRAVRQ